MAEPFIGEIRMTAFSYAPKGFALCNGQILPVNQNQALYSLLGNTFGGNATQSFALPNLQGRTPLASGNGFVMGQQGGESTHTLSAAEIPSHTHAAYSSSTSASQTSPVNAVVAAADSAFYGSPQSFVSASADTIGNAGSNQPHQNMQPYCTISFCIALVGLYPQRS